MIFSFFTLLSLFLHNNLCIYTGNVQIGWIFQLVPQLSDTEMGTAMIYTGQFFLMFFSPFFDDIIAFPKSWSQAKTGRISYQINVFPVHFCRFECFLKTFTGNLFMMFTNLMRDHACIFRSITIFDVGKDLAFIGNDADSEGMGG